MMWFPEFTTRYLPGITLNVALVLHSNEAFLATGVIFIFVHFFSAHGRPESFPADEVIFSGYLPLEHYIDDRPAEYENRLKAGTLEQVVTLPPTGRPPEDVQLGHGRLHRLRLPGVDVHPAAHPLAHSLLGSRIGADRSCPARVDRRLKGDRMVEPCTTARGVPAHRRASGVRLLGLLIATVAMLLAAAGPALALDQEGLPHLPQ